MRHILRHMNLNDLMSSGDQSAIYKHLVIYVLRERHRTRNTDELKVLVARVFND